MDADRAAFLADLQVPWGVEALGGTISTPAWKTKPSWYLVATEDRMIPPATQRLMAKRAGATVVEARGSHAIYESQPARWPRSSRQLPRVAFDPSGHRQFRAIVGTAQVAVVPPPSTHRWSSVSSQSDDLRFPCGPERWSRFRIACR